MEVMLIPFDQTAAGRNQEAKKDLSSRHGGGRLPIGGYEVTEYEYVPGVIIPDKDLVIASTPEEMAILLFTAIYARYKAEWDESFSDKELTDLIGTGDWNELAGKAISWLSTL